MSDWLKVRRFALAPGAKGESLTAQALRDATGISDAEVAELQFEHMLGGVWQVNYDLRKTSLAELEAALKAAGITIAMGWWQRLRNLCIRYCETIQRDTRDVESGWDAYVRAMYISRYCSRRHGRLDDRPQQWRGYLANRRD